MGEITSLFARKIVAAGGPGLDAGALLASVGIDIDAPWDPAHMIADTAYYGLLERMAAQIDVTDLPLRVGAAMEPDEYGALGLAWKAAPTLGGSFARVERYARLWTSIVSYELQETERGVLFIEHRTGDRRLGMRLSVEADMASAVAISRKVSPVAFTPLEVQFQHDAPRRLHHHEAYFGCPVRFGAPHDALLIAPEALAQPNLLGDEGITRFLLSHLDTALNAVSSPSTLEQDTKQAIARSLSEGKPKMAEIARSLGMSARSFHRRLSEHGLSFQTLTEATRRELAEGLLREQEYALAEIAFLTGFSEQSAFTRAFKRWVGMTPANYRKARIRH